MIIVFFYSFILMFLCDVLLNRIIKRLSEGEP